MFRNMFEKALKIGKRLTMVDNSDSDALMFCIFVVVISLDGIQT